MLREICVIRVNWRFLRVRSCIATICDAMDIFSDGRRYLSQRPRKPQTGGAGEYGCRQRYPGRQKIFWGGGGFPDPDSKKVHHAAPLRRVPAHSYVRLHKLERLLTKMSYCERGRASEYVSSLRNYVIRKNSNDQCY